MCDEYNESDLSKVLDTINRVIDVAEEKVSLKCEKFQKEADNEIFVIRNNWQTKYNEVCHHMIGLLTKPEDKELRKSMKSLYMSNTVEKK